MNSKLILTIRKNRMQLLPGNIDATIDNAAQIKVSKDENAHYQIEPGTHTVRMSFRYLGVDCGIAQTQFPIKEGETLLITYQPPKIVFNEGEITIER